MTRWMAAAVAGVVILGGVVAVALLPNPAPGAAGLGASSLPAIGGPFRLVGGGGKVVTDADFRGRYMLIYFGYTHCPDACPTTLGAVSGAIDALPAARRGRVVPIFITVDPDRDTAPVMARYAQAFGPEFVGLTGGVAQISAVEAAFHVYAAKTPLKGGDYAMDHSSVLYLMGPDGGFVSVLDDSSTPQDLARQLLKFGV